jgi:glycosyltransferase involved in cell wall biosynthesis
LGLANNISWLGEQVAIDEFLRASDIFVLPSHEEGFSNALLEAMANGVSVIATAVGGNRDAVVDEESGLLVPSKDSHALGAAISRLAKDSILRARLGEAGRQRVRDHFSLEACIRRYETLYREVCKQQPESIKDILPELITPSAPAKLPASTRPK